VHQRNSHQKVTAGASQPLGTVGGERERGQAAQQRHLSSGSSATLLGRRRHGSRRSTRPLATPATPSSMGGGGGGVRAALARVSSASCYGSSELLPSTAPANELDALANYDNDTPMRRSSDWSFSGERTRARLVLEMIALLLIAWKWVIARRIMNVTDSSQFFGPIGCSVVHTRISLLNLIKSHIILLSVSTRYILTRLL